MNELKLVRCKDCVWLEKCPSGKICVERNEEFARFCQFWKRRKEITMREILFRGKRIDNGEWVEGYYLVAAGMAFISAFGIREPIQVDGETVGQYTGLTANGKKIFEGDIIRYADEYEYRMYLESLECPEEYEGVDFSDLWTIDSVVYGIEVGYPAFDLNKHDWEVNGLSNLNESCTYFYEVIGNIYDNPELLEVSE